MKTLLLIFLAGAIGCARPGNVPRQSELLYWGQMSAQGCQLGNNNTCTGNFVFSPGSFTATFYYCTGTIQNGACQGTFSCTITGTWIDLNSGDLTGNVKLVNQTDQCYGTAPGTTNLDGYDARVGQIAGTP